MMENVEFLCSSWTTFEREKKFQMMAHSWTFYLHFWSLYYPEIDCNFKQAYLCGNYPRSKSSAQDWIALQQLRQNFESHYRISVAFSHPQTESWKIMWLQYQKQQELFNLYHVLIIRSWEH